MLPFVLFVCFVSFKTRKVLGTMAAGFVLGFQEGFLCVWRWKKAETELSAFNFKPSTSYQQTIIQVNYLKLVCPNSRTSIELSFRILGRKH